MYAVRISSSIATGRTYTAAREQEIAPVTPKKPAAYRVPSGHYKGKEIIVE